MNNAIFVSINPKTTDKIEKRIKTYEFRNYIPKKSFNKLYVYVTTPICKLKYIMEISNVVHTPQKIEDEGDGNNLFNEGKKAKYAYRISKVYKLDKPIELSLLKEKFNFTPPQSYAYQERYKDLSKIIDEGAKKLIWKR